jgi:hypothetical protein
VASCLEAGGVDGEAGYAIGEGDRWPVGVAVEQEACGACGWWRCRCDGDAGGDECSLHCCDGREAGGNGAGNETGGDGEGDRRGDGGAIDCVTGVDGCGEMAVGDVFWPSMANVIFPPGIGSLGWGLVAETAAVKVIGLPTAISWEESVSRVEVEVEALALVRATLMEAEVEEE